MKLAVRASLGALPELVLALLIVAAGCSRGGEPKVETPRGLRDHHVHLLSPRLMSDWTRAGIEFSRPESVYTSLATVLGDDSVDAALVLSMAYLYGSRDFAEAGVSGENERDLVAAENDFIASQVRQFPDRAAAFCGVNPLKDYALDEIARCAEAGMAGVKLHLANSDISLQSQDHVARVKEIFALAKEKGMAVMLHFDNPSVEVTPRDVEILVSEVIGPNGGPELYIAHLGGYGGYSSRTRALVTAFSGHINGSNAPSLRNVYFDLSAVVLREASYDIQPPNEERLRQLADDLRGLGLNRVVFGSDYPVFNPAEYRRTLAERLPLTAEELASIDGNTVSPLISR